MNSAQPTLCPEKPIQPRKMAFDMGQLTQKFFFRNNPILSTFMYALSAAFPAGERFFIDSVRHYQKKISDPILQAQVRGFIGQEAHHSHVHEQFNAHADTLGMAMGKVEQRFKNRLAMAQRRLKPAEQLAVTAAIEHITATLAQWTLETSDSELVPGENSPLREMLIWHAMEEIEHKAVAFDVYRAMVNNEKIRISVAKLIFRSFWIQIAIAQFTLLWHSRTLPSLQHIREAWEFMWGKRGVRRWAAPEFQKYLQAGFHPNHIDQSHLLAGWHENHPEVAALQVA